jgi:hypothetical protein
MSRRTGRVPPSRMTKLPRYLQNANQLLDRDWEVLQHFELILTIFETVVKTLEGDGQIRTRRNGWQGLYGNVWDVVLAYELLLGKLEELKQSTAILPDFE